MSAQEIVIAAIQRSLGLEFEEDSHTYRWDGKVVPSVTQIVGEKPPDILPVRRAMERGTRVDAAINEVEEGLGNGWGCLERSDEPFFEAYLLWRRDNEGWTPAARQLQLLGRVPMPWGGEFLYSGTLDGIYDTPEGIVVVEDKTWVDPDRTIPKHYRLQVAGYTAALCTARGAALPIRRCLRLLTPGTGVRLEWCDDPSDLQAFYAAVILKAWRKTR